MSVKRFLMFRHVLMKVGNFVHANRLKCLKPYHLTKPYLILMLSPAYTVKFDGQNDKGGSECQNLAPKVLMRNAAICAVDSATSLLTQTTCRLLELESEYVQALHELIILLEANIASLDNDYHQQQIWDALLTVRHRVNQVKQEKLDTEAVFHSAVRMLESAAEAAHGSGAEYAGIAGSERLFSARSQVKHAAEISEELEQKLNKQEVKSIEATTKHEEKIREKRREKSETETGESDRQNESDKSETSFFSENKESDDKS